MKDLPFFPAPLRRTGLRLGCPLLLASAVLACSGGSEGSSGPGETSGSGGAAGAAGTGGILEMQRYFLRIDDTPVPAVVLELDKQKALEVFGVDAAKTIKLLDVDTTGMLVNVIHAIQNACGTGWKNDNPDPQHDCSLTPLGQTFGPNWKTTPELAFVRVLSMTPANAVTTGTSLSDFQELVDGNPQTFVFKFADVLAESMGIAKTDPFIPTDKLVQALQAYLLGTHPAIGSPTGTMPIRMYDALNDMTPLAEKLGPVGQAPWTGPGEHPGVLVPDDSTFTTRSDALSANFKMRVTADSNLHWVSGIVLGEGAGDMFVSEGSSPLSIDFIDPNKVQIEGVADTPTMDMRFSTKELTGFVSGCTSTPECKSNLPAPMGTPVPGKVWSLPKFFIEPLVARGGHLTYANRVFSKCYLVLNPDCLVGLDIGTPPDPTGWAVFTNTVGGVTVPAPQFLWELLNEVAQVALHDPTGDGIPDIAEGNASPIFTLKGVGIGLSGAELVMQMRPALQQQAGDIANLLVGRYWKSNDPLDFYYRRAAPGGEPYLFFVAETDLVPDPFNPDSTRPYTYDKPGFYSDPLLSNKLSSKTIGSIDDTIHEKYRLPAGSTAIYAQDSKGKTYEIRFFVPEGSDPVEVVAEVNAL